MELLAEDLRTQTSPMFIWARLHALTSALEDRSENNALVFVRAGGLPAVIAILRGTAMSNATATPHATTDAVPPLGLLTGMAGAALKRLLCCKAVMGELSSRQDVILPLIDVLSNASIDMDRLWAAEALLLLAQGHPAHRRAMAEGGVMGPLVVLYMKLRGDGWAITLHEWVLQVIESALQLAHLLLSTERAAVHDLKRIILAPETPQSFTALFILKDSLEKAGGQLVPSLNEVRIVDMLVATLKHDAPHCVSLAAAALDQIAGTPAGGQALVEASGAVPALVGLLEKASPPGDPARDTGLFERLDDFSLQWGGRTESVHLSNPTAFAAMALGGICKHCLGSRPALNSIVESGVVPALVRLLKKTTCPVTLWITANTIQWLLNGGAESLNSESERPTLPQSLKLGDEFYEAGLCQAVLHILKTRPESMHGDSLCVLGHFITCVCPPVGSHARTYPMAMAVLVSGGIVELATAYMAQAGPDSIDCGLAIFRGFRTNSKAMDRVCRPKTVDSLMNWFARWPQEAEVGVSIRMCCVLAMLLHKNPCLISAAIRANVLPGLVRTLRVIQSRPSSAAPAPMSTALHPLLHGLNQLLQYDYEHAGRLWETAIKAGVVRVLIKSFPLVDGTTTAIVVLASYYVMVPTPKGKVGQLGAELLREVAQVVAGSALVEVRALTAKVLLDISLSHPELTTNCHTWGIEDSVRQLTLHSDSRTADTAKQLEHLLSGVAQGDHIQDRRIGPPGSNRPGRPSPNSAGTPKPSSIVSGGRHTTGAASHTTLQRGVPSEAQAPKQPAEKASSTGAGRGWQGDGKLRACTCCGITADKLESGGKLKECSACRSVRYCGTECQKAHWQEHKATCKLLQASRA